MPHSPTVINSFTHRTKHLDLKYYDCIQPHTAYFERNLIRYGYNINDNFLRHHITVCEIIAIVTI